MRNVPWWGVLSSAAAPVLLVGGSTIAAALQPPSFDPVTDTVSILAAVGAVSRWLMTLTFLAVGTCDVITGLALRPASAAGRLILVAGAAVGMLVAAYPQQAGSGGSLPHAIWASAGFAALAVWPAGAWRRGPGVPWGLRPAVCAGAVAVLVCLLAWFAAEVVTGAGRAGLAEWVLGVAQAVWPLTVVLSCRHRRAPPDNQRTACTGLLLRHPQRPHQLSTGLDAHFRGPAHGPRFRTEHRSFSDRTVADLVRTDHPRVVSRLVPLVSRQIGHRLRRQLPPSDADQPLGGAGPSTGEAA